MLSEDDEIIEDVVGDVKYTDSMKSILTRSAYTDDFTDSSPERYNSSGKETYVIDDDSDDSRVTYDTTAGASEALQPDGAASSATGDDLKSATRERIVGPFAKRLQMCSLTTHEIFTQTSRTIIEIAEVEGLMQVSDVKTQTSFITITENKTVQYKVEDTLNRFNAADPAIDFAANDGENVSIVSKYEGDGLKQCLDRASPAGRSALTDEGVKGTDETETDDVSSASECDIEEDSLMSDSDKAEGKASVNDDAGEANGDDTDKTRSEDGEMGELYAKLIGTIDVHLAPERHNLELSNLSTMTPLTEESKHSLINITPRKLAPTPRETRLLDDLNEKIKSKRKREDERSGGSFELPHVHRRGAHCGSPRLSILFSVDPRGRDFDETEALPQLIRTRGDRKLCNSLQVGRTKSDKAGSVQLPPIHSTFEGHNIATTCRVLDRTRKQRNHQNTSSSTSICIRKRINELKYSSLITESESASTEYGGSDAHDALAQRSGDAICAHFLQRLRSESWLEVREALQELPGAPRAAWRRAGERAVAALVRQVVTQVESPRPAVACGACAALAAVLKNTNYTKKPDFYEAVTCLLSKTGSRSRPVRRAANRALDEVVCGVDLHHALAALCLHGVGHKSALVRCAFARLVVVCAALAGAGRGLLRARPAAAAAARRHVLRALAALLNDRYNDTRLFTAHAGFGSPISMPEGCDISSNVDRPHAVVLMAYDLLYGQFLGPNKEYNLNPLSKLLVMVPDGKRKPAALGRLTRKYAERLYAMLRPLKNFEAYYLTDVDVDVAVAHMKKYDKLLPAPATQRPAS